MIKSVGDRTDKELEWLIANLKRCITACAKYDDVPTSEFHKKRLDEAESEYARRKMSEDATPLNTNTEMK